jgi:hypothetical protein
VLVVPPPPLLLPPLGLGAATTGAGALVVVTGGGEECVVTGGACVVAAAVVVTGLGLGCAFGFLGFVAGSVVVVWEVVAVVVAGVDAAGVDVVLGVVPPPQPATANASAIVLRTIRFINPAPILASKSVGLQGTRHPRRLFVPVSDPPN